MLRFAIYLWLVIAAILSLALGLSLFYAVILPAGIVGLAYIIGVWVIP